MVTETPAIFAGSGTPVALAETGANCDPNTVRIIPGAKPCRNEAPLAMLVIEGVAPDITGVTVTVKEAVAPLYTPSPLYWAVMVCVPTLNWLPFTVKVAV